MSALKRHAVTILLCAAALAVTLVVLVDRGSVSTGEAEQRKQQVLPAWRHDDLTELTVTARGRTARLARKTQPSGEWTWDVEIDGRRGPAEEQFVDQYLGSIEFATWERKVSASVDRAAMKLDAPRVTVKIGMGALRYELVLGGEAPSPPGAAYLEVPGVGTFVVGSQLATALDVDPDSFRSRKIVPYLSTELAELHLDGEGGERHLVRAAWSGGRGAGFRFHASGPAGDVRADADRVDRILVSLGQLKAERFSDAAAGEPRVTITLVPRVGDRAVIEVGAPCPGDAERILARRTAPTPLAACVGKGLLDALLVPASDLVDRKVVGASPDEVQELTMRSGDRSIDMARTGEGWHLRAPSDRAVPADIGKGIVEGMTAVAGEIVASPEPASLGLSPPRSTLRVVSPGAPLGPDAGGDRIETIEIGEERPAPDGKGKVVYVRRAEDGAILVVEARAASALLPSELSLRPRKVLDVPARNFRSIVIETPDGKQRLERQDDGAWDLLEPKGKGLASDLGLAMDVAGFVGGLTAERWVASEDDGTYGLSPPRIVIEAKAEEAGATAAKEGGDGGSAAKKTIRVELGHPAMGGTYARVAGDPAVFVAPKSLEASVTRLLVDRQAIRVDDAGVVRVTLSAGKKKAVVVRQGDKAVVEGVPDSAARASAILEALDVLSAENAVSVGPPKPEHKLDEPRLIVKVERAKEPPVELRIGAGDVWRGITIFYVRRDGIDATFAVAEGRLRALLDSL